MQRESTGHVPISDAALVSALMELKEAEGEKQYIHCRFGFAIANALVSLGLAMIDDACTDTAVMRITLRGRTALVDR